LSQPSLSLSLPFHYSLQINLTIMFKDKLQKHRDVKKVIDPEEARRKREESNLEKTKEKNL